MKIKSGAAVLLTAAILISLVVVLFTLVAVFGVYNVAADSPHTVLTGKIIAFIRERSIDVRAKAVLVPPLDRPDMVFEGAEHYDAMCTGCHLAPGMGENEMLPGMNPKPPILARMPVGDPAEQFWVIKHGIKMSGMPAWGFTHSDVEIWNMVAFLQKLPTLSTKQYRGLVAASAEHHENGHDEMNMPHRQ